MFYGNFASRSPNVGMHDWGKSFAVVPSGRRHRAVRLLQFPGPLAQGMLDPVIIPYPMPLWYVPVPVFNPLDLL